MKELKKQSKRHGYLGVALLKNNKHYHKLIHRLVAQAFIPNPDNKPQVNHIDENKANNHVSNLEWTTAKENCNYGARNERVSKSKKGLNHPRARAVVGFKINDCEIKYYKYMRECEKDGFHHSTISECCKGKLKSYKGYKWYYADEFFNKNK